jgi:hypothetical protein
MTTIKKTDVWTDGESKKATHIVMKIEDGPVVEFNNGKSYQIAGLSGLFSNKDRAESFYVWPRPTGAIENLVTMKFNSAAEIPWPEIREAVESAKA